MYNTQGVKSVVYDVSLMVSRCKCLFTQYQKEGKSLDFAKVFEGFTASAVP